MSSGTFLLLSSCSLACGLILIHGPLLISGPRGEDYLAGLADPWQQCYWNLGRDAVAGLGTLLALLLLGSRKRPGGSFAVIAAVVAAPALSYWLATALLPAPLWAPAAAVLGAVACAPLMRERGISSLVLVSAVVAVGLVTTRRDSLVLAREAQSIQVLRMAILEAGLRRHFIVADEDLSPRTRRVLALSLWPDDELGRVDLLCLPDSGDLVESLRAAGWRGMRIKSDGFEILAATAPGAALPIELSFAGLREGRPELELAQDLRGGFRMQAVTPCGTVEQLLQLPEEALRLQGESLQAYSAMVAGLPAEMPILLRLQNQLTGEASPWILVRLP